MRRGIFRVIVGFSVVAALGGGLFFGIGGLFLGAISGFYVGLQLERVTTNFGDFLMSREFPIAAGSLVILLLLWRYLIRNYWGVGAIF